MVRVVYTALGFIVWCIVDKSTTALPLGGAYDTMVRFPENPNTEDLSGLVLFGCISRGISALFCAKFQTHELLYLYYRNLNNFLKITYL